MTASDLPTVASYTAFAGQHRAAAGTLAEVATALKRLVARAPEAQILVFDDGTGAQVDMNLHGTLEEVLRRLPKPRAVPAETPPAVAEAPAARGVGRPKLGVVAREVTLLPRHWEWLATQPGGASVALRKLVERVQRDNRQTDRQRQARDASYKFMTAMAGDQAGFEEAIRALYAGNRDQFEQQMGDWPEDVRAHAKKMASASFDADQP